MILISFCPELNFSSNELGHDCCSGTDLSHVFSFLLLQKLQMFNHNHMDFESKLARSDYMGSSEKFSKHFWIAFYHYSGSYESTLTKIFKKVDARDKRAPKKKQFCSDESSKLEFLPNSNDILWPWLCSGVMSLVPPNTVVDKIQKTSKN